MAPERNDPCPCGSGRKYKHCCGKGAGKEAGRPSVLNLPPEVRERAREVPEWQADMVALPSVIAGKERSRIVALMVAADDTVLWTDVRPVSATEPEDVAVALEEAVAGAAAALGALPETVLVRRQEVAAALGPLLRDRGCRVEEEPDLSGLDALVLDLVDALGGQAAWPAVAPPPTWAAWGLPSPLVAALFQAYARFYEAAPWRWFDDVPPLSAEWDDGDETWLVSVMGAGMGEFGVAVYSDPDDFDLTMEWEEDEPPFQDLRGWIVHLGYNHRREVERSKLKEISLAGWEVAGLEAYPFILPILTPGGGLQQELVRRLTELLDAVVGLAGAHGEELRSPAGGLFTWKAGRLTLQYFLLPEEGPSPDDLSPGLDGILEAYNATPLEELAGISPDQARALLEHGLEEEGPLRLAADLPLEELEGSDFLADARAFLTHVGEIGGAPATAAGNLKRVFVAEILERMRFPEGSLEELHRMKPVVNEDDAWPLHVLRVNLELAGLVRRRKGKFLLTGEGKKMALPRAAGRLFAHLFRVHFGRFNLKYGRWAREEPDLQSMLPLLLWQIGMRAQEWISVEVLARSILPAVLEDAEDGDSGAFRAGVQNLVAFILWPLTRFGLLEIRAVGENQDLRWRAEDHEVRVTPLFGRFISFVWE